MTSSTKLEVHKVIATPPEEERATAAGNMHRKSGEFSSVVFDVWSWTNRHDANDKDAVTQSKSRATLGLSA